MTTRRNLLARSKKAENRVSKYLWSSLRDWKEQHDISGLNWFGEVKNYKWPTGPKPIWTLLHGALEQVEGVSPDKARCFSVYLPPHIQVEDALVMHRIEGIPIIEQLKAFKKRFFDETNKGG